MTKALTWTTRRMKLSDLIEWEKNPVQISEREAKELAKSLDKFEHVLPYVAAAPPNGHKALPLLDGHQRKMVELQILKRNPHQVVDVRIPSRKLTEHERQELAVRLRKNTGTFDFDKLANFFDSKDLIEWGFSEKELLGEGFEFGEPLDAEPQIDRAAELLEKWKVKTGDLWQIAEHRLVCGDCTDKAVVERVMGGEKAGACVTDPPYNVGVDYQNNQSDSQSIEQYTTFSKLWFKCAQDISKCQIFTPGTGYNLDNFPLWFGIERPKWMAIWIKKNTTTHSTIGGFQAWEPILIYGDIPNKVGQNVYDFPIINQFSAGVAMTDYHPTPKRLALWEKLITDFSKDKDILFEPFCGSGTTLVACENLGRKGRGIEISPAYCAVTLERMSQAFPSIEIKRLNTPNTEASASGK